MSDTVFVRHPLTIRAAANRKLFFCLGQKTPSTLSILSLDDDLQDSLGLGLRLGIPLRREKRGCERRVSSDEGAALCVALLLKGIINSVILVKNAVLVPI